MVQSTCHTAPVAVVLTTQTVAGNVVCPLVSPSTAYKTIPQFATDAL